MATRTDHREVPHLQKMCGSIIQDVSWVMTHGACGDEMHACRHKKMTDSQSVAFIHEYVVLCSLYIQAMQCTCVDIQQQVIHLASIWIHGVDHDPGDIS